MAAFEPAFSVGSKIGRILIVSESSRDKFGRRYLCRCECGNTKIIPRYAIVRGRSKSCGCLQIETLTKGRAKAHRIGRERRLSKAPDGFQFKAYGIKKRYGLDWTSYMELIQKSGGQCEICGSSHHICVDHDHNGGRIRGVLCRSCNQALGLIKDNPSTARRLASYLSSRKEPCQV